MSKQFIIKAENPRPYKRRANAVKQEPVDGVMIITPAITERALVPHKQSANVKVISTLDIKSTRMQVLGAWQSYTPEKIVGILRQAYPNIRTLSVMLSRFKKQLSSLENPPPENYLDGIKLQKGEYNTIRKQASDGRAKGSMNVVVISNADDIVTQALHYICSDDPNLCYSALLICSGLRPVEILKVAKFGTKLNNNQGDKQAWFACQSRFAKRGNVKSEYNPCRDRCFLCPYWLIERALNVVRKRWPVKHMGNVEINRRYSSSLGTVLQKAYPQWPGITAKLCRRFFAVFAYEYFGRSFFMEGSSQSSLIGFSHWMSRHSSLSDEAIAYQSLVLRPKPKMKLIEIGKTMKVQTGLPPTARVVQQPASG